MTGGEIYNNYGRRGSSIVSRELAQVNITGGTLGEGIESKNVSGSLVTNSPTVIGANATVKDGVYAGNTLENNQTIIGDSSLYGPVVNNGTIKGEVFATGAVENNGSIDGPVILAGTNADLKGTGTVSGETSLMGVAAKLGDTKFSTLQEAINAAQAGECYYITR